MFTPYHLFFFFNAPPTTEIYTLSLHDALPISTWSRPLRCHGSRKPARSFFSAWATMLSRWLCPLAARRDRWEPRRARRYLAPAAPFLACRREIGRAHV